MHKRPLAVIAVFFIMGIALARSLPVSVKFIHVLIVTLILIFGSFIFSIVDSRWSLPSAKAGGGNDKEKVPQSFRTGRIANIFLLLSITSFAALLCLNSNIFPNNHISHFLGEEKLNTDIIGIIKSPALTRRPYYGKINSTYLFEVEAIKCTPYHKGTGQASAQAISAQENLRLNVQGLAQIRIQTEKDYGYGDRLLVKGTIRRPSGIDSRSRGNDNRGFNYREYLERQNIFALVNTKETDVTVLSHNYKSNPVIRFAYVVREKLKNQFLEKMPLETGAFMRAILLGDRSELPKKLNESFRNSGTMHILPVQCRRKYSFLPKSIITL